MCFEIFLFCGVLILALGIGFAPFSLLLSVIGLRFLGKAVSAIPSAKYKSTKMGPCYPKNRLWRKRNGNI
jgi:hypothetical protein